MRIADPEKLAAITLSEGGPSVYSNEFAARKMNRIATVHAAR